MTELPTERREADAPVEETSAPDRALSWEVIAQSLPIVRRSDRIPPWQPPFPAVNQKLE